MPGNVDYRPKNIVHSRKQNLFLVVYELNGVENEVVLYRENTDSQLVNSKDSTVKGLSSCNLHVQILTEDNMYIILICT